METITIEELKSKIIDSNPVHIVDVRTDEETAMGIIPNAKTIPMNQIPENLNYFNDHDTYYIICKAGPRIEIVKKKQKENGVHAVNVEGGMNAWGSDGLEINSI